MSSLRISLHHADLLQTPCSIVFMKHIEGTMSGPETALNAATKGALQTLYTQYEREDFETLDVKTAQGPIHAYIVNFHKRDLPFSYRSVDRYARTMLRVASTPPNVQKGVPIVIVTAVHGPGAGLDASESMETLIRAFANELVSQPALADTIGEVVLVEQQKDVFDRLQERLAYLGTQGLVTFDGTACVLNPGAACSSPSVEAQRVQQLALRHLFVAMPYAKEFNNVYYFGIKQPIEARGRKCERVDQDAFTGDIVDRIKTRISQSELVIGDITGNNPNVFFEIGYAEGLGKTVILISQAQDTPFDLKSRRQIRYDPQDLLSLVEALTTQLDASLAKDGQPA